MRMIRRLEFNGTTGSVFAFTTERGAAGRVDAYSSFNCCGYTGDSAEHTAECRAELCRAIGIAGDRLVTARQVHGVRTVAADAGFLRLAAAERMPLLDGADALVTDVPGTAVGVFTADCVPLLLCDPVAGVAGAVHAGWKGTVGGIVRNALAAMLRMGADVLRVQAVFGPAICRKCFEVGDEVAERFAAAGFPMDEVLERSRATGKAHIDLPVANAFLLRECGVPAGNIRYSGLCTKCEPERFFSARVLGIDSGRMLTGICLR